MRRQFVQSETLQQARDACPWACEIIPADGGFWCFESADDAATWQSQT